MRWLEGKLIDKDRMSNRTAFIEYHYGIPSVNWSAFLASTRQDSVLMIERGASGTICQAR